MATVISGSAYVVQNNIDTDQIIPAQYLTLVPTIPEEYEKLGSYAMIGLPDSLYTQRYVEEGSIKTKYPIIIAGRNFGCGSSREHAPIALGAAGCEVVVAESFARIFFRNSIATGELYPYESTERLCEEIKTGDHVEVDFDKDEVRANGKTYPLKPLGEVKPVIDAGGIFAFARKQGLIPAQAEEALPL
ncbi:MAG: 3-isopropylmalate dehydratase [Methylacidiphilales bacterium]|nr:3-isopropylmalate dehydratase [Candidatus Methylacidiphilales bacterium]